jgi:hypothetical protein
MPITPLPALDRTSVNFRNEVDTFFGAQLPAFAAEANALQTDVNAKQATATTKAAEAAASSTKAGQWAENAENVTVETGKYSAKHHAIKAAASATSASGSASTATTKASEASTSATNAASSATSAETSAGTATTKAGEAAASAQVAQNAAASIADGPVTSVNGKTGAAVLAAADVGAAPTSRTISVGTGLTGGGDLSANRTITPSIATKAEAEAGTISTKLMTPLRVKEAIAVLSPATLPIRTPVNTLPASGATSVTETPELAGSAYLSLYGITQSGAQFQIATSNTFGTVLHDSGTLGPATAYTVPAGVHALSTTYWFRLRYVDDEGVWSEWSTPTQYTTAATFNSYIATPTATPSNFGDPLEGGFYAGMIWGQIAQSSSSKTLATGAQSFTVPSMTGAPIVYAGQTLEVRSRANPANKFIGTVTGAVGTTLTLSVTSIGGSGTFSDWSVMARHRLVVAPKASGEHAGITLKNANTAFPAACQTLTEGWAATEAMRNADTSTVYPAAHWARGLSIGGRADWYIPARDELELCWRNLKPVTNSNYVTADRPTGASFNYANNGSVGDTSASHGVNNNSSPTGAAYTASNPAQTAATAFRSGGAEAFEFGSAYYWSCSEYSASLAWFQNRNSSNPGAQSNDSKSSTYRVRAVRRSIV